MDRINIFILTGPSSDDVGVNTLGAGFEFWWQSQETNPVVPIICVYVTRKFDYSDFVWWQTKVLAASALVLNLRGRAKTVSG